MVSNNFNAIPEFDSNGNLPPGEHRATLKDIETKFTWTQKRKKLFDGLEKAVKNLRDAGVWQIYIDGSFTTTKDDPSDVDGCWVPPNEVNYDRLDAVFLDMTASKAKMKDKYGVDFGIAGVSKGKVSTQPLAEFFQFGRNGEPKGVLLLEF